MRVKLHLFALNSILIGSLLQSQQQSVFTSLTPYGCLKTGNRFKSSVLITEMHLRVDLLNDHGITIVDFKKYRM